AYAVGGRALWSLSSVRTCPIHCVPILAVAEAKDGLIHDFSSVIAPGARGLCKLADPTEQRPPSAFECDILERLAGKPSA
ncbi:hypothetical protein ABTD44_21400, partial [Acinetobacter baumannii]